MRKINLTLIIKVFLASLSLIFVYSIISNNFDPDLGWHLRFGQDAVIGKFPYTDTYTWPYFGQTWVNHEWGGDIIYWLLYCFGGHLPIMLGIGFTVWLAFILIHRIYEKKLTIAALLVSFFSLLSLQFVLVTRLTLLGPLFFTFLLWTLEKLPDKKTYYWWPLLIWLWSCLHGSWILAFIVINIYLAGNIFELIIKKIITKYKISNILISNIPWTIPTISRVIIFQTISAFTVIINPYGIKIWTEVIAYFTNNFYKGSISEWVPAYTYPIFWQPFFIFCATAVLIVVAYKKNKISTAQMFLFIAFCFSAWQYKRNAIYLVLICAPILSQSLAHAYRALRQCGYYIFNRRLNIALIIYFLTVVIVMNILLFFTIRVNSDIWTDHELMEKINIPWQATTFLHDKIAEDYVDIFNEFNWGGYLNWALPNARVYLDGRGAATWKLPNEKITMLEQFFNIKYEKDGLNTIEQSTVKYILLQKPNNLNYSKPDWFNRMIFGQKKLDKIFRMETPQLITDLKSSENWKVVYEDDLAIVWEKTDSKYQNPNFK